MTTESRERAGHIIRTFILGGVCVGLVGLQQYKPLRQSPESPDDPTPIPAINLPTPAAHYRPGCQTELNYGEIPQDLLGAFFSQDLLGWKSHKERAGYCVYLIEYLDEPYVGQVTREEGLFAHLQPNGQLADSSFYKPKNSWLYSRHAMNLVRDEKILESYAITLQNVPYITLYSERLNRYQAHFYAQLNGEEKYILPTAAAYRTGQVFWGIPNG